MKADSKTKEVAELVKGPEIFSTQVFFLKFPKNNTLVNFHSEQESLFTWAYLAESDEFLFENTVEDIIDKINFVRNLDNRNYRQYYDSKFSNAIVLNEFRNLRLSK